MDIKEKIKKLVKDVISSRKLLSKIQTNRDGLILITTGWSLLDQPIYTEVDIVYEIQRIPSLKYKVHYDTSDGYEPEKNYISVTSEVGDLIGIYIKNNGFAGMSLAEFLKKSGITES
jgi:hypothetical protein